MQLCSYVVKHDSGFAPNPYHGFCTLAACTPNRTGKRFERGDWLIGHSTKARGQRLVYAMCISEVLDFDEYYRDPRFAAKKPRSGPSWADVCGDNIYHHEGGDWVMDPNLSHDPDVYLRKDTKNPRVFISDHYFYFGDNAPNLPAEFGALIWERQGVSCKNDPQVAVKFVAWLQSTHRPGIHGEPMDRGDEPAAVPTIQPARKGCSTDGTTSSCEPERSRPPRRC
jgi:hypothetical protein